MSEPIESLIDRLRLLEMDHEPNGWPAVRMRDITALMDEVKKVRAANQDCVAHYEAARDESAAALALLSCMRFSCGDNGVRMQDELEQHLRDLRRDAERYRNLRRKVCIVGDSFHILNIRPTYVAPNAAIELDSAIDAMKESSSD